jgi:hypothetical protein
MTLPFTPTAPPFHVFPPSHLTMAQKLAVAPWPDADREMKVMKAQSQAEYLKGLWGKIRKAEQAFADALTQVPAITTWQPVTELAEIREVRLVDGVDLSDVLERWRRLSEELFWDEALIMLNDATLRRLA